MTPDGLRRRMNLWPPYVGAGIKVLEIAGDWSRAQVRLRVNRLTGNYFGTAFGGSLSAMSDPFYTLLTTHQLGRDYLVWDKAGEIEYVSPGRGTVLGRYEVPHALVAEIRSATADGSRFLHWFETDLLDADGAVVARVRRQVYVRRKRADAVVASGAAEHESS